MKEQILIMINGEDMLFTQEEWSELFFNLRQGDMLMCEIAHKYFGRRKYED